VLVEREEAARQRYDYPVEPRALPLPEDTVREMERVIAWYDPRMDWDQAPQPHPSRDGDAFTAVARQLLDKIRRKLGPDYEIIDEEFSRNPADSEQARRGWHRRIWLWLKTRWALRSRRRRS
jgi:hypothetical protein